MAQVKLKDLEGEIISIKGRPQEDDCLLFLCPVCQCRHGIIVSFMAPSLFEEGKGAIWSKTGTTIDDISLTPSINCDVPGTNGQPSSCRFHGWVTNGKVTW